MQPQSNVKFLDSALDIHPIASDLGPIETGQTFNLALLSSSSKIYEAAVSARESGDGNAERENWLGSSQQAQS